MLRQAPGLCVAGGDNCMCLLPVSGGTKRHVSWYISLFVSLPSTSWAPALLVGLGGSGSVWRSLLRAWGHFRGGSVVPPPPEETGSWPGFWTVCLSTCHSRTLSVEHCEWAAGFRHLFYFKKIFFSHSAFVLMVSRWYHKHALKSDI